MNFKIATSNIRFDNPKDGNNDWNGRREILAECINEFSPDILGTQEGREGQIKDLSGLLNNLQLIEEHRDWIEERMYPCIFVNPEKINVYESGDIWLSESPTTPGSKSFESAFPRLCTWVKGHHHASSKDFFYVNTHLDHVLAETRIKQIEVLIRECNKINEEGLPMILTGDFNESPFEGVRHIINHNWPELRDTWFILQKDEEPSHHDFSGHRKEGARIDWILTSPDFQVIEIELYKKSRGGIFPSDHFPVFGSFNLKE